MRIILIGILMLTFFEAPPLGCSLLSKKVPAEAYPEQVGKFKRELVLNEQTKSIEADYLKENVSAPAPIHLQLNLANDAEDAKGYLNLSTSRCSDDNLKDSLNPSKLLFKNDLKDKAGKRSGIIRVCDIQEPKFKNYYLEMTNNDLAMKFETKNQIQQGAGLTQMKLEDLVEFVKSVPHNANLDFDSLKITD